MYQLVVPICRSVIVVSSALCVFVSAALAIGGSATAEDVLTFSPGSNVDDPLHVVLISGDEEYRSEETMPMLAKILSRKHGFRCTVLFAFGPDNANYIDPNNQQGLRGLKHLSAADLLVIGTRFRRPDIEGARQITEYLNAGKPVVGIRTSTHAFRGKERFGTIAYDDFGLKILGETWVSHHGRHKVQGARAIATAKHKDHPILRGVGEIFCPSDVYEVSHLTERDQILMRASVTESLDPSSPNVEGALNDPPQAFAWLHPYQSPDGKTGGMSFCTTGGASVDFVDEDLRRLVVNACYYLTGREVPGKADVAFVDPFHPTFYGFIRQPGYYAELGRRPADYGLGRSPRAEDPPGSPPWPYRKAD